MIFISAFDVPVLAPLPMLARFRPLGPRFNGWLIRRMKWVSRSWSRPVPKLRCELGPPPGRDPLREGPHSPCLVLSMFASRFGPPQPHWPPHVHITGFPFLDSPEDPVGSELSGSSAKAPPPIVFTLGGSAVQVPGEFYSIAARAAQAIARRAVLVAGRSAGSPDHRSAIRWQSVDPYDSLLLHLRHTKGDVRSLASRTSGVLGRSRSFEVGGGKFPGVAHRFSLSKNRGWPEVRAIHRDALGLRR